jgi:hypothetical protein
MKGTKKEKTINNDHNARRTTRPRATQTLEAILTDCKDMFEYLIERHLVLNHKTEHINDFVLKPMLENTHAWIYFHEGKRIGSSNNIDIRMERGGYEAENLIGLIDIDNLPAGVDLEVQSMLTVMLSKITIDQLPSRISEAVHYNTPLPLHIL